MKEMLKKVRAKKNKKGFTLVEVIVVLVILAIMAAILIPSLIGYIDKAKENSIVSETRSIVTAVQTLSSEKYAKNKDDGNYTLGDTAGDKVIAYADVEELCELESLDTNITACTITKGKVTALTYTSGGKTCTYPDYEVKDAE